MTRVLLNVRGLMTHIVPISLVYVIVTGWVGKRPFPPRLC
jgi:hypothetical protein